MAKTTRPLLVEGPVGPSLIKLTLPMTAAHYAMIGFNLVDTAFLGRVGTAELAAISFTFPVVLIVASIGQGLGTGMSAVISRAIGRGDTEEVQRLTTHGLALALLVVVAFSTTGLLTIDPVFRLLGADAETLPLIRDYMTLWYIGVVFLIIPMTGNHAIRATGDMKTPAVIMIVSSGVNLVLDPFLIFGIWVFPEMGITGAALATVIARSVSLAAALWVLVHRERMVSFERPRLLELWDSWRRILHIGLPAAATHLLIPVSVGVVTGIVAGYGPEAVAAFGVGSRVELLGFGVVVALGVVLTPFIGQNWGAGHVGRLLRAVVLAQRFVVFWGLGLFILFALLGGPIARIFTDDPAVISVARNFLWIAPMGYGLMGLLMISSSALNALNKPLHSTALSALRVFVLYVPLALVGSNLMGVNGVFAAAAAASALSGLAAFALIRRRVAEVEEEAAKDLEATPAPFR